MKAEMKPDDSEDRVKRLIKQGNDLVCEERFEEALEVFNEAVRVAPTSSEARLAQVSFLRKQGKLSEAQDALNDAYKQDLGGARLRNEQARLYISHEKYDEAIDLFDLGHKEALILMIVSLRTEHPIEEVERVEKTIHAALRLHNDADIRSEFGWLYYFRGRYDIAVEHFDKVLQTNKDCSSAVHGMIGSLRLQREYAKAREQVQQAIKRFPERIEIIAEEGWLRLDQKYYAAALKLFNDALEIDCSHAFALQGKIASLRLQGRFQEAREWLEQALKSHPTNTGILCEHGWLFFEEEKYNEADEAFDRAIKVAPNRVEIVFSRVEALCRMNRSYDAEKLLFGLKEKFPNDIIIAEQLGLMFIRRNDLKSAEKEFRFILSKYPDNISGLNGLATVRMKEGRYEEAIKTFRQVLKTEEFNSAWYVNLAWGLVRQEGSTRYGLGPLGRASQPLKSYMLGRGQPNSLAMEPLDQAEKYCQVALELDPESASAYHCLGTIAYKRGKLLDSEDYLKTSINKNPREGGCLGLGALYVQTGRYKEAEERLNEAFKSREDIQIHLVLGDLYLQTERINEAIQAFNRAMVIDPDEDDPPRALAITYMRINKLNEAESILRDALRRLDESKRWRLHITRSQLLMRRGDEPHDSQYYEEALREAKKAILLRPNRADPYFQAGLAFAKLKDYKAAHKSFRSCLRIDEHHFDAEENDRRIHNLFQEEHKRARASFWAGFCVGAIAVVQLTLLWYLFNLGKVSETIVTILVPILLGLVVVAFLIPVLYKLKLPGLGIELSRPTEPISSVPRGEIMFRNSPPTITSGPR